MNQRKFTLSKWFGLSRPNLQLAPPCSLVVPERKTNGNGSDDSGPDSSEHEERDDIGDASLDCLVADRVAAVVLVGDGLAVEPDAVGDHTQLRDGGGETEAQKGEYDGAEERHFAVGDVFELRLKVEECFVAMS